MLFWLSLNHVQAQKFTEYDLKAAYLFNFAKFVQWPEYAFEDDDAPYVLGIYGEDPFGSILINALRGNTVKGRSWVIKYFTRIEDIDCHILFLSGIEEHEMKKIIEFTSDKPILTVGDHLEYFCEQGGMINFTRQYARHRFEINNEAALKSKIYISSKLLVLAKIVSKDEVKF